jgi:hypothetical protein
MGNTDAKATSENFDLYRLCEGQSAEASMLGSVKAGSRCRDRTHQAGPGASGMVPSALLLHAVDELHAMPLINDATRWR